MGADCWEICPRCLDVHMRTYKDAVDHHVASFTPEGWEEWIEVMQALVSNKPDEDSDELRTFREDYEWYLSEDGSDNPMVRGVFHGKCTVCGLEVKESVVGDVFYRPEGNKT